MRDSIQQASDALAANDADTLEAFIANTPAAAENLSDDEKAACRQALLVFRRQVLAARGNIILRQRLLAARTPQQESPWAP